MPIRSVVLDLDGTLYRGQEVLQGAVESVRDLRERGLMIWFVTNNSGISQTGLWERLTRMGFAPSPDEILGTARMAAETLVTRQLLSVFLVGEKGLHEEVTAAGITIVSSNEPGAGAVVAGIDRQFTYGKLRDAQQHLLRGAEFLATNRDATYPLEGGRVEPGAGSIIAALETAANRVPTVLGKPEPTMLQWISSKSNLSPEEILVVGDRMDTDIDWGKRFGSPTWLVLTGVTKELPPNQTGGCDLSALLAQMDRGAIAIV